MGANGKCVPEKTHDLLATVRAREREHCSALHATRETCSGGVSGGGV